MKNNKLFIALGSLVLSGSLLITNNAYANYPQDFNGASASNFEIVAEGKVSYEGNIVTIPAAIKADDQHNFKFNDYNELSFAVYEDSNSDNETEATIQVVNKDKGLVNLSFDASKMDLDKVYRLRIYSKNMFGAVHEPADLVFEMNDKKVKITNEGLVTVTQNNVSTVESNVKQTDSKENKEIVTEEMKDEHKEQVTSKSAEVINNNSVKKLPATSAVK